MRWYDKLYIGEIAKKKEKTILAKIRNHKFQFGVFVITLPANDNNVLDIYPSHILLQPYYKKQNMMILGIACGNDEALEVVQDIIMDSYQTTGDFRIKDFIESVHMS